MRGLRFFVALPFLITVVGVSVGKTIEGGDCFELRYRVSRAGEVQKLSQRVVAIDNSNGCDAMGE